MTIIMFLVDTSASMNQKTYIGTTILDLAKGAVETFLKFRQRDPSRSLDRYMLLTFEDPPYNVKAGWKENQQTFIQELKSLKASGLTNIGGALSNAFHLLNTNRLQSGIDNFGCGRCPHYLEPVMIIVLTDGNPLLYSSGVQSEIQIPIVQFPGSELTKEPFRWDQRIFSVVLRVPGVASTSSSGGTLIPPDPSPLSLMCEVTGGRSYCVSNHRMLNQCLESLVLKVQPGVVLYLEKYGPDPVLPVSSEELSNNNSSEWMSTRKMIFVPRNIKGATSQNWPMPEQFWVDPTLPNLPARSAHPMIMFKCEDCDPMVIETFAFDKYEMEPSPLTQFILQRKQPHTCWQMFAPGSGKYSEMGSPFGYLKASTTLTVVNAFVMPYNYPILLPLIDDLMKCKGKPSAQWKIEFDKYLRSIPVYYIPFLRRALQKLNVNVGMILPENFEAGLGLSYNAVSYLKRIKLQAKQEMELLCAQVTQSKPPTFDSIKLKPRTTIILSNNGAAAECRLKNVINNTENIGCIRPENADFPGFTIQLPQKPLISASSNSYSVSPGAMFRNPFDIPRSKLISQITKMRQNLTHLLNSTPIPAFEGGIPGIKLRLQNAEELHNLPIAQMGNYQEYLRRITPPLRDIDAAPARTHAFGNPFKVDKRMLVDEADIDSLVANSSGDRSQTSTSRQFKKSGAGGGPVEQQNNKLHGSFAPARRKSNLSRYHKRRRSSESGSDSSSICSTSSDASEIPVSDLLPAKEPFGFSHPSTVQNGLVTPGNFMHTNASSFTAFNHSAEEEPTDDSVETLSETSVVDEAAIRKTVKTKPSKNGSKKQQKCGAGTIDEQSTSVTVEQFNELKRRVRRLVRKPGNDYEELLTLCKTCPASIQNSLIKWADVQAAAFQRSRLCVKLRELYCT